MDNSFQEALLSGDPNEVAKVPKSDLHNHSLMGCRRIDMEAFYGGPIRPFQYCGNGIHDVNRWIAEAYVPVFRKPGAFEAAVSAAFRQAKSDGVSVLEMSIDAGFGHLVGMAPEKVGETFRSLHLEVAPEIGFRPELGFARHLPVRQIMAFFAPYLELGYFRAIDLYDDELSQPVKNFREIYRLAKSYGLKCKAHAGEFGNAESVREAVEVLELDAVQHGIAAARSPEVMKWLAERRIPLNICPTSNVVLERAASIRGHPIRTLYDNGVRVTVNSDDVILFGQSVSQEFLNLFSAGLFSADELDEIRRNGLSA
jgi:adenosine deaminase